MVVDPVWMGIFSGLAGLAGGTLAGLFGIGGGVVLVPLLSLLLSVDQHRAQGISLAVLLLPINLAAVLHYRRQGVPLRWDVVAPMAAGFVPGVLAGALAANHLPGPGLRMIFAGFLAVVAVRMLLQKPKSDGGAGDVLEIPAFRLRAVAIGLAGGALSGLLGIGGGLVLIPLMGAFLAMRQHEAQLASLALLLLPLGLPAVWIYARTQGGLPWGILMGIALGFVLGTLVGARLATGLRGPQLRKLFAALLLVVSASLAWKGLRG